MSQSTEADESCEQAGFTMIEALVALVVIAVSLVAIGSLIAVNVRSTEAAEQRLAMDQTAQALLTALPDRNDLTLGESRGEVADERWRIDVLPFAADFIDPGNPTPWVPQAVILRVQSPNGSILRIDTVRLRSNRTAAQ